MLVSTQWYMVTKLLLHCVITCTFWHFTDLLNEVNCRLQIKAKVNELPVNALSAVFILLQYEHCVIEQLLKLFICVVDAQLFKWVELQHIWLHEPFNTANHTNQLWNNKDQLWCLNMAHTMHSCSSRAYSLRVSEWVVSQQHISTQKTIQYLKRFE